MNGPSRTNICAEISLILGVFGFSGVLFEAGPYGIPLPELALLALLAIPAAVILGVMGRKAADRHGESTVVANLGIVVGIGTVILAVLAPGVCRCGGASRRAQFTNNLKQVGLALHNYHSVYGRLPPAVIRDKDGRPLYSWRVAILPYLEVGNVYDQFHLDEAWDSPHNRAFLEKIPMVYRPLEGNEPFRGATHIQAFVGPGTAFESPRGEPLELPDGRSNFPDGMDRTLMVVDASQPVAWTQPADLAFTPEGPLPAVGGSFLPDREMFALRATQGYSVLFADGNVRYLKKTGRHGALLREIITRNDGLPLGAIPR